MPFREIGTLKEDQFQGIRDYEFGFKHVEFHPFIIQSFNQNVLIVCYVSGIVAYWGFNNTYFDEHVCSVFMTSKSSQVVICPYVVWNSGYKSEVPIHLCHLHISDNLSRAKDEMI